MVKLMTDEQIDAFRSFKLGSTPQTPRSSKHYLTKRFEPELWMPYLEDAPGMTKLEHNVAKRMNVLSQWRYYLADELKQRFMLDSASGRLFYNMDEPSNYPAVKAGVRTRLMAEMGETPWLSVTLAGSKQRPVPRYQMTLGPWGIRGAGQNTAATQVYDVPLRSKGYRTISPLFAHAVIADMVVFDPDYDYDVYTRDKPLPSKMKEHIYYRPGNLEVVPRPFKVSRSAMSGYLRSPLPRSGMAMLPKEAENLFTEGYQ